MIKSFYIKIEEDFIYIKSRLSIFAIIVMYLMTFILYSSFILFLNSIYNSVFFVFIYIAFWIFMIFNNKLFLDELTIIINKKEYTIDAVEGNGDSNKEYIGRFREIKVEGLSSRVIDIVIYGDISREILLRDGYWSTEWAVSLEKKFIPVAKDLNIPITNSFTKRR